MVKSGLDTIDIGIFKVTSTFTVDGTKLAYESFSKMTHDVRGVHFLSNHSQSNQSNTQIEWPSYGGVGFENEQRQ